MTKIRVREKLTNKIFYRRNILQTKYFTGENFPNYGTTVFLDEQDYYNRGFSASDLLLLLSTHPFIHAATMFFPLSQYGLKPKPYLYQTAHISLHFRVEMI